MSSSRSPGGWDSESEDSIIDGDSQSDAIPISELLEVCEQNGIDIRTQTFSKHQTASITTPRLIEPLLSEDSNLQIQSEVTSEVRPPPLSPSNLGSDERIDSDDNKSVRAITPSQKEKRRKLWKRNANREKRMRGEAYLGFGVEYDPDTRRKRTPQTKLREERKMGPPCSSRYCKIRKNLHCSVFTSEIRSTIFGSFWKGMDWGQRQVLVKNLVDLVEPRRQKNHGRTVHHKIYHLHLKGKRLQVCNQMFLNTLGIGEKQVRGWLKNVVTKANSSLRAVQNVTGGDKLFYKEFLKSLPKMESHYCRENTSKLFLEPIYQAIADVYKIYQAECIKKQITPASESTFYTYFKMKKYSLHLPKKDLCDICASKQQDNITDLEFAAHVERKKLARDEKVQDKLLAEQGNVHVVTMDVQKVLLAPVLNASAIYFKTKLVVHNFTVYDLASHEATCYLWDETQAEVVASSFSSCLLNYLEENYKDKLPIIIFSDGCTNQNRNAVLSGALSHYAAKHGKIVIQKYLEKGHTQMECDSVHSLLERKMKNKPIYLPTDYVKIFKEARTVPSQYKVRYLSHLDFHDYTELKVNIRPGIRTGDPVVTDLRQIRYNEDGSIQYKLNHKDQWSNLPRRHHPVSGFAPPLLYKKPIPIKKGKYQDLQSLLHVLPKESHHFYTSLQFK